MNRIDENRLFIPVNIAILTVSDSRTLAEDRSGDTLAGRLTDAGHKLAARAIVIDDRDKIAAQLREWIADPGVDENIHEVHATGEVGSFSFQVRGRSLSDNPRSSALAAMSVVSKLEEESKRILF